jgi:hypothetical protein
MTDDTTPSTISLTGFSFIENAMVTELKELQQTLRAGQPHDYERVYETLDELLTVLIVAFKYRGPQS